MLDMDTEIAEEGNKTSVKKGVAVGLATIAILTLCVLAYQNLFKVFDIHLRNNYSPGRSR